MQLRVMGVILEYKEFNIKNYSLIVETRFIIIRIEFLISKNEFLMCKQLYFVILEIEFFNIRK